MYKEMIIVLEMVKTVSLYVVIVFFIFPVTVHKPRRVKTIGSLIL